LLFLLATVGFADIEPVTIKADAGFINYDMENNITTATKNVKVIQAGVLILADRVVYNGNNGIVEATGDVHLTRSVKDPRETQGEIEIFTKKMVYHSYTGIVEADGGVKLIKKAAGPGQNTETSQPVLRIEAEKIRYEANIGLVKASGNVRVKNERSEYTTQHLSYNIMDMTGSTESFSAVLEGEPRDFFMVGRDLLINQTGTEFSKVKVTRCPKEKPDYTLSAKTVTVVGAKVSLKHVVLRIKGVPVFYFPVLTFYTDRSMPQLEPGWEDGMTLKYNYLLSSSPRSDWSFKGELLSKQDEAYVGMGLSTRYGKANNQFDISYYLDGHWKLADRYQYDIGNFAVTLDGSRNLSAEKESQLGVDLTRKYRETSIGRWRAGVSTRWVSALDSSDTEYGGIYSGFRLDYQPFNNVTLSYLGIRSHSQNDYRDLMEDFGVGGNGLYQVEIPINKTYKFDISGTYNFTDSKWYHQVYRLTMGDCCLKPTISYDQADQTWKAGLVMDF
jgi:lipopolysaccharide assembly outer membrane protein LptD (OstA)